MPEEIKKLRNHKDSIVRAMLGALRRKNGEANWPERSFAEIQHLVSKFLGRDIPQPTIRSIAYKRPDLFERACPIRRQMTWRLTKIAQKIK